MALTGVTKLALTLCRIRDLLENDFTKEKVVQSYYSIEKFMGDIDRQLKKAIKDEMYELDFMSADLIALADAAEMQLSKLRPSCTFKSIEKKFKKGIANVDEFNVWMSEHYVTTQAVAVLQQFVSGFSYQAMMTALIEAEKDSNKFENVCLEAILDELKSNKNAKTIL